jgi:hypothetical protein
MYKYNQSEFESMMDELMHDFKKGCGKSEAELDVAYKILNPSPVGGFVDSLVKMDKDYSTNLWEIKRKQIKSFIPECDGYQLDDIVAYCRAKFFKEEVDRIIYDNSIAEECDVCVYADGTILSPEWPYLCAKVYVSIKWITPAFRLNKRVETLEEHDRRDYESLRRIAERDSLILEVLSTMLDSQISGNNVEELKKTKQKLTNYLAQNQR